MIVAGVDPRAGELVEGVTVEQQVGARRRRAQVPTLDHRPLRAEGVQGLGRAAGGGVVDHLDAGDEAHLVEVRRHQRRDRDEGVPDGVERLGVQQRIAVHGRAHRVHHQRDGAVAADAHLGAHLRDGLDDRGGREHAGLGGRDADVLDDAAHLRGDRLRRDLVKTADAHRVLHRHRGDRDARVHPAHRHGARIGLDAGTAAGVGAGDGEGADRGLAGRRQGQVVHGLEPTQARRVRRAVG